MKAWSGLATAAVVALSVCPALAGGNQVSQAAAGAVALVGPRSSFGDPRFGVPHARQVVGDELKLEQLIFFTPHGVPSAPVRFARAVQRHSGGSLAGYERFFRARWSDFEAMLLRYGMRPNDLSTARAFAIVAAYKAYNGDHLSDVTSGTIFRTMLAVQTAARQWDRPWSDARKQDLYTTWALQGAVLNWFDDDARKHGDAAQHAVVRAQARTLLRQQLGRDPDKVKLDTYACTVFQEVDCAALMRELRSEFATVAQSP